MTNSDTVRSGRASGDGPTPQAAASRALSPEMEAYNKARVTAYVERLARIEVRRFRARNLTYAMIRALGRRITAAAYFAEGRDGR